MLRTREKFKYLPCKGIAKPGSVTSTENDSKYQQVSEHRAGNKPWATWDATKATIKKKKNGRPKNNLFSWKNISIYLLL